MRYNRKCRLNSSTSLSIILSAIICLGFAAQRADAGLIAISPTDSSNQVKLYDMSGSLQETQTAAGFVQDISFDQGNGDLYAFLAFGGTVAKLPFGGAAFQPQFNTGFTNLNSGADMEKNDLFAISPHDFSNQVRLYDSLGTLQNTLFLPAPAHDLAYDLSTGDLYAYAGSNGSIYRLSSGGSTFQMLFDTGFVNFGSGADLTVHNGDIALTLNEFNNLVRQYDTSGTLQDTHSLIGPVHDISYDQNTGDLYALAATTGTVLKLSAGGTDFQSQFDTGFINLGSGADIAIFTAPSVPEPATLALLGLGLVCIGFSRRRAV